MPHTPSTIDQIASDVRAIMGDSLGQDIFLDPAVSVVYQLDTLRFEATVHTVYGNVVASVGATSYDLNKDSATLRLVQRLARRFNRRKARYELNQVVRRSYRALGHPEPPRDDCQGEPTRWKGRKTIKALGALGVVAAAWPRLAKGMDARRQAERMIADSLHGHAVAHTWGSW